MNWPIAVAEAVRDKYIHQVDDPDWHGGERAAQEIADLLRKCGALPKLTPTMLLVLRVLRTTKCATGEEVTITEYSLGSAAIFWHSGSEVRSLTVLPSTLKRLRDLGLVEVRSEQSGNKRYGLSVSGALVSRFYDRA
jgi:DNA-binding transcriptional ArsR family regulator